MIYFASAGGRANVVSLPINVNPSGGFNSYWPIPFKETARITLENQRPVDIEGFFYQTDYILNSVPEDCMYFHACWRRSNPVPYKKEYIILDGVKGKGRFAGVYMPWGQNNNNWWGEGEVKYYIDDEATSLRIAEQVLRIISAEPGVSSTRIQTDTRRILLHSLASIK